MTNRVNLNSVDLDRPRADMVTHGHTVALFVSDIYVSVTGQFFGRLGTGHIYIYLGFLLAEIPDDGAICA